MTQTAAALLTTQNARTSSAASTHERRRADRIRSGPLRIEVLAGSCGTLIDLNEFGALMELPQPAEVNSRLTFDLYFEGLPIRLHGRVVRSTPCWDRHRRVTWGDPSSYHVAVEFFDVAAQCAVTLLDAVKTLSEKAPPER